jgi:hypothetical protein
MTVVASFNGSDRPIGRRDSENHSTPQNVVNKQSYQIDHQVKTHTTIVIKLDSKWDMGTNFQTHHFRVLSSSSIPLVN